MPAHDLAMPTRATVWAVEIADVDHFNDVASVTRRYRGVSEASVACGEDAIVLPL